jgi:hypothetical protein
MTQYLLENGKTPTGFGVRLRSNGTLRAISPCCGRSMVGTAVACKNCTKSYDGQAHSLGVNLIGDITIDNPTSLHVAVQWIERLTGYDPGTVHLKVDW